jgi:hypothetical protein
MTKTAPDGDAYVDTVLLHIDCISQTIEFPPWMDGMDAAALYPVVARAILCIRRRVHGSFIKKITPDGRVQFIIPLACPTRTLFARAAIGHRRQLVIESIEDAVGEDEEENDDMAALRDTSKHVAMWCLRGE